MMSAGAPVLEGRRIRVRGWCRGGFPAFVWRLACDLGLAGDVRNDGEGVLIAAWGAAAALDALEARRAEAPRWPAWQAWSCPGGRPRRRASLLPKAARGWRKPPFRLMPPPAPPALPKCKALPSAAMAIFQLHPLRPAPFHRPRHPVDRPNTAMAAFALCPACRAEYDNPADRRFHAQPIAWALPAARACGWKGRAGAPDDHCHRRPAARGGIVAIKGLGGFHLACDALNADAVAEPPPQGARCQALR
jgi:hydrogenase maturation protein HypF